jgi:hypothetical protein
MHNRAYCQAIAVVFGYRPIFEAASQSEKERFIFLRRSAAVRMLNPPVDLFREIPAREGMTSVF